MKLCGGYKIQNVLLIFKRNDVYLIINAKLNKNNCSPKQSDKVLFTRKLLDTSIVYAEKIVNCVLKSSS